MGFTKYIRLTALSHARKDGIKFLLYFAESLTRADAIGVDLDALDFLGG